MSPNLLPGLASKYQDLDNVHYDSFRVSVVARPTDTFENYTIYSYNQASEVASDEVPKPVSPPP